MSRRDSRASLNVRQNDYLGEFESFKKKFLLANRQITKLNSNLSIRIEELQVQLSTLNAENLRLRASEISLASALRREREKSSKVMGSVDGVFAHLTQKLSLIRSTFDISTPTSSPAPMIPRATSRPIPSSSPGSPSMVPRVAKVPDIPGIWEEEEPEDEEVALGLVPSPCPTPPKRKRTKDKDPSAAPKEKVAAERLSASRLPLPARVPASAGPLIDLGAVGSRKVKDKEREKQGRRKSGLIVATGRPQTPATQSLDDAGLDDQDDELAIGHIVQDHDVGSEGGGLRERLLREVSPLSDEPPFIRAEKEKKGAIGGDGSKTRVGTDAMRERERSAKGREREREKKEDVEEMDVTGAATVVKSKKNRLKDVTNSPTRKRPALMPLDNAVQIPPRTFLTETLSQPERVKAPAVPDRVVQRMRTPSPSPPPDEMDGGGGRTRRVRTSVNYAEPKLNTKMRKPDPPPGTAPEKKTKTKPKRMSAAAVLATAAFRNQEPRYKYQYREGGAHDDDDDVDEDEDEDVEEDDGGGARRSSLEGYRERDTDPVQVPLPPSHTGSSESPESGSPDELIRIRRNGKGKATGIDDWEMERERGSDPNVIDDDDDEGAEADGEYVPRMGSGVSVSDGRRKSAAVRRLAIGPGALGGGERRRSMAV